MRKFTDILFFIYVGLVILPICVAGICFIGRFKLEFGSSIMSWFNIALAVSFILLISALIIVNLREVLKGFKGTRR